MQTRTVGVIAEFNPFHNGHAALVRHARALGFERVVCVMSGYFVQRGECALVEPFTRARMACACGADVVALLPYVYAGQSARYFAKGGVRLLHGMGVRDVLCGMEDADTAAIGAVLEVESHRAAALQSLLRQGRGYAAAYAAVFGDLLPLTPNNTLALEYARHAWPLDMRLHVIPRTAQHDSAPRDAHDVCSASHLRALVRCGDAQEAARYMPPAAYGLLARAIDSGNAPTRPARLDAALVAALRVADAAWLRTLPDVSEGLAARLIRAACVSYTLDDLCDAASTTRYTRARVRRAAHNALLRVTASMVDAPPRYARVLAYGRGGRAWIADYGGALPLVTHASRAVDGGVVDESCDEWAVERRCAALYGLTTGGSTGI